MACVTLPGDDHLHPRVAAYLARLPAGVASHPECQAKAAMLRRALEDRPLAREHVARLPVVVRQMVTCPPLDGEWVPDVWLVCALFAMADVYEMTDDDYLRWMRERNTAMFNTLFRVLMKVSSPETILARASERWAVFHRGSSLAVTQSAPGHCVVQLTFPPRLWHGLALLQFAPVLEAALRMSHPEGRVELATSDDITGQFVGRWRA